MKNNKNYLPRLQSFIIIVVIMFYGGLEMDSIENAVSTYLEYCEYQKSLNNKTLKAYRIDLRQFTDYLHANEVKPDKGGISSYAMYLHKAFKPKTVKRKIASIKALFAYLEYEEIIAENPFSKIMLKFKEPSILPRTISLQNLQLLFGEAYHRLGDIHSTESQRATGARNVAVLELMFATGVRVSELCNLKPEDLNLEEGFVRIFGKGSKERTIQIADSAVLGVLSRYRQQFEAEIIKSGFLFVNRLGGRLSEQSVRFMIQKYCCAAGIAEHITPHMFRHTFATMLLEEDVDIRYIQQILGHSSILTTQIYTHVTSNKQRDILLEKSPRKRLTILLDP